MTAPNFYNIHYSKQKTSNELYPWYKIIFEFLMSNNSLKRKKILEAGCGISPLIINLAKNDKILAENLYVFDQSENARNNLTSRFDKNIINNKIIKFMSNAKR